MGVIAWMFSLQYVKIFRDRIEKHGMIGVITLKKDDVVRCEARLTADRTGKYYMYELMVKSGKRVRFRIDQFSRDQILLDWFSDIAAITVRSSDW
jgi:hypothetical protein